MEVATIEFFRAKLRIDEVTANAIDFSVKRRSALAKDAPAGPSRGRSMAGQVIVRFSNTEDREMVRSRAKFLRSDASSGIDIAVPDRLRREHRALQGVAYRMKKKTPGLKRNILFDDFDMCFKMHFTTNGEDWQTIMAADALQSMEGRGRGNRKMAADTSASDEAE